MKGKLDLPDAKNILAILEEPGSHNNAVLVRATISSLRNVWWVIAGFALLALLLSCITTEHGLGIMAARASSVSVENETASTSTGNGDEKV
jgi:hypothetical protein